MNATASKRLFGDLQKANRAVNAGRRTEALLIYDEVLQQASDDVPLHIEMGHLCSNMEQFDKAIEHYSVAVGQEPENAQFLGFLGVAYQQNGQPEGAFSILNRAMEKDAEIPSVLHALGIIYMSRSDYVQAKEYLQKAERLKPSDGHVRTNLAITLSHLNEHDPALEQAEKAVKLSPTDPIAHYTLGRILTDLGRMDEAIRRFEKTIRQHKTFGGAYDLLARMKKFTSADQAFIDRTENILQQGMPAHDRRCVHFALGKMYDDCKEWEKAFEHYRQANLLQKKPFDAKHEKRQFKKMKKIFNASSLEQYQEFGHQSEVPVFIVGMPRSGTTLMERIVASHPRAAGAGELPEFPNVSQAAAPSENLNQYVAKAQQNLTKENLHKLADRYLHVLMQGREGANRVVDKLPGNFFHVGMIATLFPNATIIHARRHPLDTGLSCYFQNFTDVRWANDFKTIGEIHSFTDEVMDYWQHVLPDGAITEVIYEDLVEDTATQGRRLLEACGLTWDEKSLEFHREEGVVKTASFWQARQPIYKTSKMRWMNYAAHLGELADALTGATGQDLSAWQEKGVPVSSKSGIGLLKKLFN